MNHPPIRASLLLGCLASGLGGTGCRPAPAPVARIEVAPGQLDARALLAPVAAKATAMGAGELVTIGASLVSEGDQLGSFITVPADRCALAVAWPGSSVRDVDLFAFDDAGSVLAADESPQASAAVMVCPPHPKRLYLAARIISGTGLVALGVVPVAPDRADAVARVLGARGRPGQDSGKLGAWPGLQDKLRARRKLLGGFWEDLRRATLALDPHAATAVSVVLDAGRCLDVFVTPSDEVQSLDLQLVDAQGRVVARGKSPELDQAAVVCGGAQQDLTVLVRPRAAHGTAALVIARTPAGAAIELSEHADIGLGAALASLPQALKRQRARLAALGWDAPRSAGEGEAKVGGLGLVKVALDKGCSRIEVVGGAPLGAFVAELWSDGVLLDRAAGGASAALFACDRADRKAEVEVAARERAGPFAVEVRHAVPTFALAAHPLAAARLLSRVEAELGPVDLQRLAGAEAIEIGPGARVEQPIALRQGCAEWVAAADGARDLSAQIIDQKGELRGLSSGRSVASVALCSDAATQGALRLSATRPGSLLLWSRPYLQGGAPRMPK